MISPSESAGIEAGVRAAVRLPERLMKPGTRSVARLEFYPANRPEPPAEMVAVREVDDTELLMKETESKGDEVQAQTEEIAARIERARSEAAVEARVLWETELEERIARERSALQKVGEDLLQERTRYFAGVEGEVVRVPTDELEMWQGVFGANEESAVRVVGDERLGVGECVLETNVGRVELGVSAQLEEIERGFFDLMQQRPA
jgi:flagellar assembly protein FliH